MPSHRRSVLPALALALAATALPALPASSTAPARAAIEPELTLSTADPLRLDRPARGRAAVRALGDLLDDAAHLNDQRPAELRALLLEDPTAWLDTDGRVYFKDTAAPAAAASTAVAAPAPYPLSETFLLHSKAGSQRTIYLDVDGHTVSGTQWNSDEGVSTAPQPAWDPANNGAAFTDTEREAVQRIWQRVSEDYAPFDVDVTTQDPGNAAIARTNGADQVYGTRVLITPGAQAHDAMCGVPPTGGCGGIAYLDAFDETGGTHAAHQPAWVFPHRLGNDVKSVAEAVSHEVGHTLSLEHDGRTDDGSGKAEEYYGGHGIWAPIMGSGYDSPVVQWSQGDYPLGNNHQDDLAGITASGLSFRTDEAGGTVGTAALGLPVGAAYVSRRTDVDVYALGTCTGPVSVDGLNAPTSPNLDLRLRLLDQAGTAVATADPAAAAGSPSWDVATGTDATVSATLAAGTYFVEVDGVGTGSWTTQYDDYGSLGAYTLALTGSCGEPAPGTPGAPLDVVATADDSEPTVTVTWDAPATEGDSAVTGYVVTGSPGGLQAVLGPAARSTTFTDLTPGTSYSFSVAAQNATGTGPIALTQATTAASPVVAPSAPLAFRAAWDASIRRFHLRWDPPASDGGAAIDSYDLYFQGTFVDDVAEDVRSVTVSGSFTPGRSYAFAVAACNTAWLEVGCGPVAHAAAAVPAVVLAPGAPRVGAAFAGRAGKPVTAGVRWTPPTSTGGAAVTGYVVLAHRLNPKGKVVRTLTSSTLGAALRSAEFKLPKGRYRFVVKARNTAGFGPLSAASTVVRAR